MSETLEGAPVAYALGVHAFTYVATHLDKEAQHSKNTVVVLDEYLALRPEVRGEIVTGSRDSMGLYQRLFEALRAGVFGPG